ncbi:sister chromatid cohesion protein PDS5 homolog D-like isoform X3 [Actinidia eriantha]|uniref:sister chromatid cohesion protein PDS5 homolog D-like isoform X3 n=1 Tax=Actinidia eriantha TaxID=165200 RepID=UPI00258EAF81|nr:sister chromatid cohesion protein PDS5 homolog D-like isoform X3 [Actinidia eriantha]
MFGGKARRLITIVISVIKKKIQWRIGIKRLWRRLWSPRKRSITRINLLRLIYSGSIDATTLLGGESRKESNGALTEEDSIAMSPTNKVRSCVAMLDLECECLIVEMFQHFLKDIRC